MKKVLFILLIFGSCRFVEGINGVNFIILVDQSKYFIRYSSLYIRELNKVDDGFELHDKVSIISMILFQK
jgi:hypothetical protein